MKTFVPIIIDHYIGVITYSVGVNKTGLTWYNVPTLPRQTRDIVPALPGQTGDIVPPRGSAEG